MSALTALMAAFIKAFMIGLGVGVAFGAIMRLVRSVLTVVD